MSIVFQLELSRDIGNPIESCGQTFIQHLVSGHDSCLKSSWRITSDAICNDMKFHDGLAEIPA